MSARQNFALREPPSGCFKCGGLKPTSLNKVKYRCTGGNKLTALALLAGFLVYTETTFAMKLPLCASCASQRRRKTLVLLLLLPVVVGLFVPAFWYGLEYPVLFAMPVVAGLVLLLFAAIFQAAATPKAVRLTRDTLVIDVPGYGHLTLAGPEPAQAAPPKPRDAGPQLNRSVCGGCGFINFGSAVECKKCRAPLGRTAAAGATATFG
jgi:hypothetical protein